MALPVFLRFVDIETRMLKRTDKNAFFVGLIT